METIGNALIHAAFVLAFYAIVASLVGGKTNRPALVATARNAVWALWVLVATAVGILITCFLKGKYYMEYVYQYSNSTMPTFYKVAALWGGQNGSLLFWLLILCTYSSIAVFAQRKRNPELFPYVIATLMTIAIFFIGLLIFVANPFDTLPFTVPDGKGLNPLLQNYYMIIHPPSLYLGYVGMSVPFAFAMAALISGRLDNQWVLQIRHWILVAWFFLSCGNLLGASWAYEVLGWGGYWAWDPVENAAFMPWLSATAFLHSVIIQEKRGMLRTWNMVLVVLSFLLTLTGTFLTRSGIISSVHSFAQSDIGTYFLAFLLFTITVSGSLIIYRLPQLRAKNNLDSLVSRESAFLFNNLVLVGAAFAILWGTLFPVLSEWVRGTKITVGPPFFNSIMIPIGLVLLLLTGIGPIVGWRKTTPEQLKRNFIVPVTAAIITSTLALSLISKEIYVILSFSFSAFVLATVFMEYQKGIAVRKRTLGEDGFTAFLRLIASNRRRYGGYIVHVGVVLLFVGFTGNAFKKEQDVQLKPGDSVTFGRYVIRHANLDQQEDKHKEVVLARLQVWRDGKPFKLMSPAKVFFKSHIEGEPPQPGTEVAISRSLREDLYIAFLSFDPNAQTAFLKIVVNPLVQFIWIGGLFLILGTIVGVWPEKRTFSAGMLARAAALALFFSFIGPPAVAKAEAVSIDERVETIAKKLRCECGCNFPDLASCSCDEWARPNKAEIRARLSRGEDENTILKYFVSQFGEKILTTPVQQGFNYAAWMVPAIAILIAGIGVTAVIRRWSRNPDPASDEKSPPVSTSEDERLRKELDRELYGS